MTDAGAPSASEPVRFGLVGSGKRSADFAAAARALPSRFHLAGVVTREEARGRQIEAEWSSPTYRTIDELVQRARPEFVVVSVPWPVTPVATKELVARDTPVLAETPPAPDTDAMADLWREVGRRDLVQVAEQYLLLPQFAATYSLLRSGQLGRISWVSILSRGLYHSVSLLRHMLDATEAEPLVMAAVARAPLAGVSGVGLTHDEAEQTTAILDFGENRVGIYDFATRQWSNPLRPSQLTVRGSLGQLTGDSVIRMDPDTGQLQTLSMTTERMGTGRDGELIRICLDGDALYCNPYVGSGLPERYLSVAALLDKMGAWTRGTGPAPYPLAEGCRDHVINLTIAEAAREQRPLRPPAGPWSDQIR